MGVDYWAPSSMGYWVLLVEVDSLTIYNWITSGGNMLI